MEEKNLVNCNSCEYFSVYFSSEKNLRSVDFCSLGEECLFDMRAYILMLRALTVFTCSYLILSS